MKRLYVVAALTVFVCVCAQADEEGMSRTSWGRFAWWEMNPSAETATWVDGLLSYNVTLEGLSGVIRSRQGERWLGGPPANTQPLRGNSRIWQIKLGGGEGGVSNIVLARTWKFSTDPEDKGVQQGWEKPGFDDAEWGTMMVGPLGEARAEATGTFEKEKARGWGAPLSILSTISPAGGKSGAWENQGLEGYDGFAWYRLEAVIPEDWKEEKVFYRCHGIDDEDHTYVNGVKIGETTYKENPNAYRAERTYEIPAEIIQWGKKNSFTVRVFDDHGFGGFTGSAPELLRGEQRVEALSVKPRKAGEAPRYVRKFNWVTKWIELPDYKMTYSLATALARVSPKGKRSTLRFDLPVRHAAYVAGGGVEVSSADGGTFYKASRDGQLEENWVLLWHGSAAGHNEDMPVLVVLHGKPTSIAVKDGEVTIDARGSSFDLGPPFGLRQLSGSDTERWAAEGLPADILEGCRFWSRATLAYPVGHKELYNVDHDREMVTFTEKYEYEIVEDDWGTEPLKIAAVPPIIACLLDADYPGKMLTQRTDPGFVGYSGPFAATVESDTAKFELPIPVEDSFAGLATPGQEDNMDEMTRATLNLMHRWSGWDWKTMDRDSGRLEHLPPDEGEPMDFDQARERALTGDYPVLGIPEDHVAGKPLDTPWTSSPLNHSILVPPFLIADPRVRPGIIASIRRLTAKMDTQWSDKVFYGGIWRAEVEPTCKKPMTYVARYLYKNLSDRFNGEAPYDFTSVSGHIAYGFKDAGLWTGRWDMVRKRWHKLLQACDPYWRNHDWATTACDNKDSRPNSSVDITWDNFGGLEALTRCAYAIGDMKTYDFLCYVRARLGLGIVAHEALQRYLQPVLRWPDNYFAGHVGEPYPPFWSGIFPESGVAREWSPPFPEGALNFVPWRFNNAGVSCPGVGFRWMAMTQPEQVRWVLGRMAKHVPNYLEGRLWGRYAENGGPPFLPSVQMDVAANSLTMRYFLPEPSDSVLADFSRLAQAPALIPFNVERMTHTHGRGQLQNLLYTRSCPMWASAWEPRVIWEGRYDPAAGEATIIVEPGDSPLRFKGSAWVKPLSVAINGKNVPERNTLKEARADGGWYYGADRKTIHVLSSEQGRIEMAIRFKAEPDAPKPAPRMVSEKAIEELETNLLTNGSFDRQVQNVARSPFVGPVTGPFLYVNRWMAPGPVLADTSGPYREGLVRQVAKPWRTAGLSLRMCAGKDAQVIQNVAAAPGPHRLTAWMQLGRRQWNAAEVECKVILQALRADGEPIKELADASLVLAPSQIERELWRPIVIEIDAPEGTNALRAGASFLPLGGDGDTEKENPVYVDDLELVRVERLTGDVTEAEKPAAPVGEGLRVRLAVHWTFDTWPSGQKVQDASGKGNHGKLAGNIYAVDGVVGKAMRFDGLTNDVTSGDFRKVAMERGNFTIAMWFKTDWTDEGGKEIFECGQDANSYPGIIFQYRVVEGERGRLETYLASVGKGEYILSRPHPQRINDGKWHHLALTVDRKGEAVTYIDGDAVHRQDISAHSSERLASRGGARLGRGRSGTPDFEFELDDFRVYSKALSQEEVLQVTDEAEAAK